MDTLANPGIESASRFQWNAGGWFGGIVGATLGLPSYAYTIHEHHPARASLLYGMFAVVPVLATLLWLCRSKVSARTAFFVALPVVVLIDVIGSIVIWPVYEPDLMTKFQSLSFLPLSMRWLGFAVIWLTIYLLARRQRRLN